MKSKIIIIVFSAVVLGLTACSGKSSKNQDAHNPETCTDHVHEQVAPKQESFKVEADSSTVEQNHTHDHSHDNHDHKH